MSVYGLPGTSFYSMIAAVVGSERTERECGEGDPVQSRGCPRNCKR
jgi:hypothetical protein